MKLLGKLILTTAATAAVVAFVRAASTKGAAAVITDTKTKAKAVGNAAVGYLVGVADQALTAANKRLPDTAKTGGATNQPAGWGYDPQFGYTQPDDPGHGAQPNAANS